MRIIALCAMLCLSWAASAQTQFGKWTVEAVDDNTVGALTTNDSGSVFGKLCFVSSGTCVWMVSAAAPCDNSSNYVALSNSLSGANTHTLTCYGDKKLGQLLTFNDYQAIETISNNDNLVGFALPMLDGQFKVMRFDLDGSTAACAKAEAVVAAAGKTGTADLNL